MGHIMDEKLVNLVIEGYNTKVSQLINTTIVLEAQLRIANEKVELAQKELNQLKAAKTVEKK